MAKRLLRKLGSHQPIRSVNKTHIRKVRYNASMRILGCLLALISYSIASAQVRFVDKPQNNGFSVALAMMHARGWFQSTEIAEGLFMHLDPTRDALAISAIQVIPKLPRFLLAELSTTTELPDDMRSLRTMQGLFADGMEQAVQFWLTEFAPEIKKRGGNLKQLKESLASCKSTLQQLTVIYDREILRKGGTPRFKDVPFKHWAETEVQELRDAGILVGYSDGLFRG